MSLVEQLIAIIAPHYCIGCEAEGDVICASCRQNIQPIPERCYKCRKATPDSLTCPSCRKNSLLRHVWVAGSYDGIPKDLVHMLKFDGVRAAAQDMAAMMAPLPVGLDESEMVYIVHIPTATSRVRQRGYDQAELLAQALAKQLDIQHRSLITRIGQSRQVGAKRADRLSQLQGAFRLRHEALIKGAHIVLVDDVITTGATLETAARALKKAGARQVDAIVFAQA